ncbi:MAG: amidohydrolase family protein, partial [Stellaceae bacterium]
MKYDVISADCHVDLIWLPPDLFIKSAPAALKDRMPYVTDGPRGREWVTRNGASFGLDAGMGSAGRPYQPGKIHRSDRMATTGLFDPEQQKVRRLTDPGLRLADQDRDGVQAEILYGILGATNRLNDDEAAGAMLRIYNDWLADFCSKHPERYGGLANIPNHDRDEAVAEVERVAKRGNVRGLEVARRHDMTPLWDPWWNPVWDAIAASGLPVHFHTIGGPGRDFSKLTGKTLLAARAASISNFQMHMADVLMSMIFAGV